MESWIDGCSRGSGGRLWRCSCTRLIPLALGSRGQPFLTVWPGCGTPPDRRLSHGCNLSLCAHRWDSVPWQGDDTLHWTFEMTQRFKWKQAIIKYLPAFSESFIFYLFHSPQYCCSSLQPSADKGSGYATVTMLFTDPKRKKRQPLHVRLLPNNTEAAYTCHTHHVYASSTERVDSDVITCYFLLTLFLTDMHVFHVLQSHSIILIPYV